MQLSEFPEKLNTIQIKLLEARLMYETLQDRLMQHEAQIKGAIANDKSLKNDAQRKAAETEAKSDPRSDYYQAKTRVSNHRVLVLQLEIELQLWRDHFSVAKLEKREEIAQLQASSLVA